MIHHTEAEAVKRVLGDQKSPEVVGTAREFKDGEKVWIESSGERVQATVIGSTENHPGYTRVLYVKPGEITTSFKDVKNEILEGLQDQE